MRTVLDFLAGLAAIAGMIAFGIYLAYLFHL